jgi:gamma-glutamyltranspeptidase/glutathione hydrolase
MQIFSRIHIVLIFLAFTNFYAKGYPVNSYKAMVVSECSYASDVGIEILKNGGNAIDAAVATAFTLAVTYPEAGNIGGGGFMVIHFADGENTTIDFREKAPLKAFAEMFLDDSLNFDINLSTRGWTASGVPGSVAGLLYALEKYGTMSLADVIQPAIQFAKNGFNIPFGMARLLNSYCDSFKEYSSTSKIFIRDAGDFQEGDIIKQLDLAKTLELIRDNGRDGFYKGKVAKLIVEQSQQNGGYFSYEDLESYQPIERKPIIGNYKGHKIISMGPASSGGISLVQALNALENIEITKNMWGSSRYIHSVSEVLKYVYSNRSKHIGDMDFYPVPIEQLINKEYGLELASKISANSALPSSEIFPEVFDIIESDETTHYSVIDEYGNAVSVTTTINGLFGNKIIVEGAGFFLNNEMDDFSAKPGSPNSDGLLGNLANSIEPGKRMLSSMTPTIVLKDDKPFIIVGARGGSTIITTVMQIILNVIEFDMNIQEAVDAPRFHHQWMPDEIQHEPFSLSLDVKEKLTSIGQNIGRVRTLGKAIAIHVDHEKGVIFGGTDKRGEGKASGY